MYRARLAAVLIISIASHLGSTQSPTAFTKGQTTNLQLNNSETILFNRKITEFGANFDAEGAFVCQTPGLYAFTFYALSETGRELWLEMMNNGQLIASIYAYIVNDYGAAGNAAILHLDVGDRVYVKARDNRDQTLYGQEHQIYTTFTGELLYADDKIDTVNTHEAVGFSAVMTVNASISDGSTVIYNNVITNVGHSYDTTSGTFTAPHEGTYVFHFHALSHVDKEAWLELFHNDQYVVASYGYTAGYYADSGNSVVLHLKKWDTVKVKARSGYDVRLYGTYDEFYTTFCGSLLAPTFHGVGSGHNTLQEVAFSVGLTHNESSAIGPNIVFDRVFTNLGRGFNVNTGVFTASVGGIYAFHYHALTQQGQKIWAELYHNFIYVNSLYAHSPGNYGSGGNSAVLELVAGDTVYLDIQHHNSFLFGNINDIYSTFTGYLFAPNFVSSPTVEGSLIG